MIKKYFVDNTGRICGECVVDNPVNPFNYLVVEIDSILSSFEEVRYKGGELVKVDPFVDCVNDPLALFRLVYKKHETLDVATVRSIIEKPRPGISMSAAGDATAPVGIFIKMVENDGTLQVGSVIAGLQSLFGDAAKVGCPVFGHLGVGLERLADIYRKLDVAVSALPDGTAIAVYDPDVIIGEASVIARNSIKISTAVQVFMDAKAFAGGYDDIRSAALRAAYPGPFHDEGVTYASWMDACWFKCYEITEEVKSGVRAVESVTAESVIAELPALTISQR